MIDKVQTDKIYDDVRGIMKLVLGLSKTASQNEFNGKFVAAITEVERVGASE